MFKIKKNFKIVQQNVEGNSKKTKEDIKEIIDKLLDKNNPPDVILFSEFCYYKHEEAIIKRLEDLGYKIILPVAFQDRYKSNPNICAACMMAVKNEIVFEQRERKVISLDLRYIEGTLKYQGEELEIFFVYAPQTLSKANDRIECKAEMVFGAYQFLIKNKDRDALICGDFNIDLNNDNNGTSMKNIFKEFYSEAVDTDINKDKPTWGYKRLDYALASEKLRGICKTTHLETESDHCALVTIFN